MWGYRGDFDTPEVGSHLRLGKGTGPQTQQKTGLSAVGLPTEVGWGWVTQVILEPSGGNKSREMCKLPTSLCVLHCGHHRTGPRNSSFAQKEREFEERVFSVSLRR